MKIFGLPLIAWSGLVMFLLIIFQLLTGFRIIRVGINTHKKIGVLLIIASAFHALLGFLYIL